ncbi:MAG: 2-oxo-4-hydroxy-4-carboxy-5-ureidoimidazoline decarboxylase [Chloroflexota bacterium]|nr:2-oxo-4-hydroxy-4-carboxy-5-ureidoimidazoline decarboxylase [Chloroflexota bacterium]
MLAVDPRYLDPRNLDRLPEPEFRAAMAPLFEGAPRFLARLAAARPFGSAERLFERALEIALAMPEDEQRDLIDAHPRLGAPPGSVSALSYVEQGYDSEAADAAAESERERVAAELTRLNEAYEARFGFRYCVFVAGRPRAALLPGFEAALHAEPQAERRRALGDIVAIAQARYRSLGGGGEVGR